MSDINELEGLMGFDPSQLDAFNPKQQENYNANIYKTNPKDSKSDDGHYRSRVKILYNPLNIKRSIVHQATYFITDEQGSILLKSKLGDGDKTCPIFSAWKKLWFSNDPIKKELATSKGKDHPVFDKSETDWVLVQILEDNNKPELVGKIQAWKLPSCVHDVLEARMKPSPESGKKPIPLMDYIIGQPLEIDVTPGPDDPSKPERKQREISYSLCAFADDPEPIIKTDGTPFFTDEELENIENYVNAKKDLDKAKAQAKKQAAEQVIKDLFETIKGYYARALAYIKENSIDLIDECAYKPWDAATEQRVAHWCEIVLDGIDPKTTTYAEFIKSKNPDAQQESPRDLAEEIMGGGSPESDDLPF